VIINLSITIEQYLLGVIFFLFTVFRMWWHWQGNDPDPTLVDFMKKNYPSDWTYADFASRFRAELFSENKFLRNR
jgi:hypothetical protein